MKCLTLALALASLVSCTTNSSIPNARRMDRYHQSAAELMKPERAALDAKRASGALSQSEYETELVALERRIASRATDAAWTRHALAESERRMTGIPTPDAPIAIQVPTAGGSGALPTQGTYRRFNEQDVGFSNSQQVANDFFRGYTPGGSVRGNQSTGGY
jgi:hypothetical protein